MNEVTDTIYIELNVTAVQMAPGNIWMQGRLEICINSEKPYNDGDLVNEDALLESLEKEGEFDIFSCCCGIPDCSGWVRGIHVKHAENIITWLDPNTNRSWHLDRKKIEEDLKTVRQQVTVFKQYFKEKEIDYVGFGYNRD